MTKISEDSLLTAITVGSIALAILCSLVGWLYFSISVGLGVAAGSGIAIINFVWQRNIMQRVLGMQSGRPVAYATFRYFLRLVLTAILLYFILTSGLFSVAGLLAGLSVIVAMISISTLYFMIHHKGD